MLLRVARTAGTSLLLLLGMLGVTIGLAPAASAHPLQPAQQNCGWTTCTLYWSVKGTKELNNKWKDGVLFAYGGAGIGLAELGPYGSIAAAMVGYKAAEFGVQVSSAATDGRCLIYKYPKTSQLAGWWGSVSTKNEYCVQG